MRGDPREQYERTYVLLPKEAKAAWAKAAVAATWNDKRYTIGGSADDAGIGDLDVRRIICVNPRSWDNNGNTIEAFFEEYYDGVEVTYIQAKTPDELFVKLGGHSGLALGLHDASGGYWMAGNDMQGVCLVHHQIQTEPVSLDYSFLRQKGIDVLFRVNWGYADGTGTMPPPGQLDAHIRALVDTMNNAKGVSFWHPWNEPNNASEWPAGYSLTPEYVVDAYNTLWHKVRTDIKLGLPPLDPYYGPGSNNMDWLEYFLLYAAGADVWFLHGGKTHTCDPQEVWSDMKFGDEPLTWQYYEAKALELPLQRIQKLYPDTPVYCTEVNPQSGWDERGEKWIGELCKYLRTQPVAGATFYRYERAGNQAIYALCDRQDLLAAIKREA